MTLHVRLYTFMILFAFHRIKQLLVVHSLDPEKIKPQKMISVSFHLGKNGCITSSVLHCRASGNNKDDDSSNNKDDDSSSNNNDSSVTQTGHSALE